MRRMFFNGLMPIVALIAAILFVGFIFADVPHLISYQGRLTDGTGTPLTGSHNIAFSLYTTASGGVAIWSETHGGVTLNSEGLYNVMLGSVTSFPSSVDFSQQYWLAVSVDGGGEICRYELGASPYALNLSSLDATDGQVLKWNTSGSKWIPSDLTTITDFTNKYVEWVDDDITSSDSTIVYTVPAGNVFYLYGANLSLSPNWGSSSKCLLFLKTITTTTTSLAVITANVNSSIASGNAISVNFDKPIRLQAGNSIRVKTQISGTSGFLGAITFWGWEGIE